ncbi:MAG TPA: hypothetical protein HA224_02380 [Nanoarchaeota archaeon]|nr:hypothetical protein [Nanoarchaeota archaeon]
MDEKVEVKQQLEQLKKEIHLLSVSLKQLSEQKESKYKEKDGLNQDLNNYIKTAKELRDKKKEIDTKIRDLKGKRQVFNKGLSEMWGKFREIKANVVPKDKSKGSPSLIQKQIEKIEFTIQTEALSFEREKKMMRQLKELKAQLGEMKLEDAKFKELRDFKDDVKEKKVEADDIHIEIQKLATESTDIFKKLTEKSELIAKAKETREKINVDLQGLKAQISEIDVRLEKFLQQWGALTSLPVFTEQEMIPAVQKKAEAAMEKLKSKGKLTKEDILAMQGQNMKRR